MHCRQLAPLTQPGMLALLSRALACRLRSASRWTSSASKVAGKAYKMTTLAPSQAALRSGELSKQTTYRLRARDGLAHQLPAHHTRGGVPVVGHNLRAGDTV